MCYWSGYPTGEQIKILTRSHWDVPELAPRNHDCSGAYMETNPHWEVEPAADAQGQEAQGLGPSPC